MRNRLKPSFFIPMDLYSEYDGHFVLYCFKSLLGAAQGRWEGGRRGEGGNQISYSKKFKVADVSPKSSIVLQT